MNLDNLIIINGCDRPCAYLVCRIFPNGKITYVNEKLRRKYGSIKKGKESSSLKQFGFVLEMDKLVLKNPSTAKYADGRTREWQGSRKEFTYNDILKMNSD